MMEKIVSYEPQNAKSTSTNQKLYKLFMQEDYTKLSRFFSYYLNQKKNQYKQLSTPSQKEAFIVNFLLDIQEFIKNYPIAIVYNSRGFVDYSSYCEIQNLSLNELIKLTNLFRIRHKYNLNQLKPGITCNSIVSVTYHLLKISQMMIKRLSTASKSIHQITIEY